MVSDDRPNHPMTFIVQLEFSGLLDREALSKAIDDALQRHPLLRANIGRAKQNRDCWIDAGESRTRLDFGDLDQPIQFIDTEYLNLRRETGVRIWVRHNSQRAVVTTQFHHATCDGIGAYQFIGDILYAYARETGETALEPQKAVSAERLRERAKSSFDINLMPQVRQRLRAWNEARQLLFRRAAVMRPSQTADLHSLQTFPGVHSHIFEKNVYRDLRHIAQDRGQTVNDMLVEKLFVTLMQWQQANRPLLPSNSIVINMPLNLRSAADQDIPACNIVANHFIRCTTRQIQRTQELRDKIAAEMLLAKHERNCSRFMEILAGGYHFIPRTMKVILFLRRSVASTILSNTGDPTRQFYNDFPTSEGRLRCGSLILEDISGVPPMRPGTRVTISIFTYRRRLKICMRCDPTCFSEHDTQQLLKQYIRNIAEPATEA